MTATFLTILRRGNRKLHVYLPQNPCTVTSTEQCLNVHSCSDSNYKICLCVQFSNICLLKFIRIPEQRTPFVIIAVQAYAEMNQYHTAVGFASKVFGNAEKFPPEVLELW